MKVFSQVIKGMGERISMNKCFNGLEAIMSQCVGKILADVSIMFDYDITLDEIKKKIEGCF